MIQAGRQGGVEDEFRKQRWCGQNRPTGHPQSATQCGNADQDDSRFAEINAGRCVNDLAVTTAAASSRTVARAAGVSRARG